MEILWSLDLEFWTTGCAMKQCLYLFISNLLASWSLRGKNHSVVCFRWKTVDSGFVQRSNTKTAHEKNIHSTCQPSRIQTMWHRNICLQGNATRQHFKSSTCHLNIFIYFTLEKIAEGELLIFSKKRSHSECNKDPLWMLHFFCVYTMVLKYKWKSGIQTFK